jgi:hypothetical protein
MTGAVPLRRGTGILEDDVDGQSDDIVDGALDGVDDRAFWESTNAMS